MQTRKKTILACKLFGRCTVHGAAFKQMRLHERNSVSQCECSASSKLYYRFSAIIQVRFDNKIYIYRTKIGERKCHGEKKYHCRQYTHVHQRQPKQKKEKEESKTASVSALLSERCCVHLSHCLAPTARLSEFLSSHNY